MDSNSDLFEGQGCKNKSDGQDWSYLRSVKFLRGSHHKSQIILEEQVIFNAMFQDLEMWESTPVLGTVCSGWHWKEFQFSTLAVWMWLGDTGCVRLYEEECVHKWKRMSRGVELGSINQQHSLETQAMCRGIPPRWYNPGRCRGCWSSFGSPIGTSTFPHLWELLLSWNPMSMMWSCLK